MTAGVAERDHPTSRYSLGMSAFNFLRARTACPVCGAPGDFEVQFKYGNTWQFTYSIGDELRWGGNDYGARTRGVVQLESIGGPCPHCAADDLPFVITVSGNRIEDVRPQRQGVLVPQLTSPAALLRRLEQHVPEFTADQDFLDLPYLIFGKFSSFIIDRIRASGIDDPLVGRAFALVNELWSENDAEIMNMIETTLFEQLADEPSVANAATGRLSESARRGLWEILKGSGHEIDGG